MMSIRANVVGGSPSSRWAISFNLLEILGSKRRERTSFLARGTPCALLAKKPFNDAMKIIRSLPENEWEKSFILCIVILSIADKRRRETDCLNGCKHEWHNIENL